MEQSASFPFSQLPSQQGSPLKGKFFPLKKDTILKSYISSIETRKVTVCNKCPRKSLIMTLIPGCDLEHSQGTSLAQNVTCHFVLLFCVTLTLGKEP